MSRSVTPEEETAEAAPAAPVKRLCNEIQLFDLCDRESCRFKEGNYCTEPDLLRKFESIADEEERVPVSGGGDDDEEWDGEEGDGFDDSFADEPYDDEGYEEDE